MQSFSSFLENLLLDEITCIGSLSKYAQPFKKLELKSCDFVSILIGPEGGWSDAEELRAKEIGVIPFSLGSNTLRLESAALAGLAVARERFIL